MTDFGWAIFVLVAFGCIIGIAKILSSDLNAEWSRKIAHMGTGCVALGFPFMFNDRLTVLYLGLITMLILLLFRVNSLLRKNIGFVIFGISRKSFGELYFLAAVVTIFLLYQEPYEYLISIAVLTFSDSIAALVGVSYGRFRATYIEEEAKSGEGSLIFFIVAYFCALIPLQLMSEIGRAEVLVISFLIGCLAALIEMISVGGNDYLLLPVLTFAFLRHNISQPLETIFIHMIVLLVFIVAGAIIYKLTNITKLSIIYALLAIYVILILGGYTWLIPSVLLFVMFAILPLMTKEEKQISHTYKIIECNTTIGLICITLSTFFPSHYDTLYLTFSLAFACHLTINTYGRLINYQQRSVTFSSVYAVLKAVIFISLPTFFMSNLGNLAIIIYLLFLAVNIHFAIYLAKKFDYRYLMSEKSTGQKLAVGTITLSYAIVASQFI